MDYEPYKGLISLQNKPPIVNTGFNWRGYAQFMEDKFTIIDKHKQEVAFKQQPAQLDFLYHMSLYEMLLVLKARKMGFSSTALGVGTTKFINGKNEKCVSMSFDTSASQKQLLRVKHYIKSYEAKKSRELSREFKIPLKYNSKNELVWEGRDLNDHGAYDHFQNALRVGTASVDSFGRGDDVSFLHLTEVSLAKDIDALMAGIGEACLPLAPKILETTANGFNSYKRTWDGSISGEYDYAALFYSPYWEYTVEYVEKKYKDLGRLGPQEYPLTPEEAFLTSGELYFDQLSLRDLLKLTKEPIHV